MSAPTQELSPETLEAVEKIKKLLNLAAKNPSKEEAASAASKAQELLAKYNLDVATVGEISPEAGKREQAAVDGGFYAYQRRLWGAVAGLNFCLHWNQQYWTTGKRYTAGVGSEIVTKKVLKYRHALIGRVVNVRSTMAMASYLSQAVERITQEHLKVDAISRVSGYAVNFREGAVATIVEKLEERRAVALDEDERRRRDYERAMAAGASTSTAVTLAGLAKTERDANLDFKHGEGFSARVAAHRAQAARERAEEEKRYAEWAAANPEEVREREEEQRRREAKNASRRRGRWSAGSSGKSVDWGAYRAGRDAGRAIGLDPQAEAKRAAGALGSR